MLYNYTAFGINLRSELAFPELIAGPNSEKASHITFGQTPQSLPDSVSTLLFEANATDIVIRIAGVANYWINEHNNVTIEPLCSDFDSVRLFFLSNVMAALVYRNGHIPLHASAIVHQDQLYLFCGNSGAGKSTTVANLVTRGFLHFTDDVCVLQEHDNTIWGGASYPALKLWQDSLEQVNLTGSLPLTSRLRPGIDKFMVQSQAVETAPSPKKIAGIFFLQPGNPQIPGKAVTLSPTVAFKQLLDNVYRKRFTKVMGLDTLRFRIISQLSSAVPTHLVERPTRFSDMDAFIDGLLNHIAQ